MAHVRSGTSGRIRHAAGGVRTRLTHGTGLIDATRGGAGDIVAGSPFPPSYYGNPKDLEPLAVQDLLAGQVDTGHFFPTAKAPQVNNAPGDLANADVIVDQDGLTIRNGKIFLEDVSGLSVLGPAGFGGSWTDFIVSGLYNGTFGAGSVGAVDDTTNPLPYWTTEETDVNDKTTASIVANTGVGSGQCVALALLAGGDATDQRGFMQEMAIPSAGPQYNRSLRVRVSYEVTDALAGAQMGVSVQALTIDGDVTGSLEIQEAEIDTLGQTSVSATLNEVPDDALAIRVFFYLSRGTGSTAGAGEVRVYGVTRQLSEAGSLVIGSNGSADGPPTIYHVLDDGSFPPSIVIDPQLGTDVSVDDKQTWVQGDLRVSRNITSNGGTLQLDGGLISFADAEDASIERTGTGELSIDADSRVLIQGFGRLRFVPLRTVVINNNATAVAVATTATGAITNVPADAKAVQIEARVSCTTIAAGNSMSLYHGTASSVNAGAVWPQAANIRNSFANTLSYSSTNGVYYSIARASGTVSYDLICTGYWTDDNS